MSEDKVPTFSAQDANSLLAIAQDAPIPGGARMAVARSELYQRFTKWYEHITAPVVTEAKPEAPPARTRKPRNEPTLPATDSKAAEDILG